MAKSAVEQRSITVKLACEAFRISQDCYRYAAKGDSQNELIAQWLVALTDNNRNWGFGLCYLYLRNVKGFGWNHKRVYRIYTTRGFSRCPSDRVGIWWDICILISIRSWVNVPRSAINREFFAAESKVLSPAEN